MPTRANRDIPRVMTPGEAAEILGMTTDGLSRLVVERGYPFVQKRAGGKPGDRGRPGWGLTEDQLRAIIKGETRVAPKKPGPAAGPAAAPARDASSLIGGRRSRFVKKMGL